MKNVRFLCVSVVSLLTASAFAQTANQVTKTNSKWVVVIDKDSKTCRASTNSVNTKESKKTIQMMYDMTGTKPIDFSMEMEKTADSASAAQMYVVQLDKSNQIKYYLVKSGETETTVSYWGVAQNTKELVSYVKPASELKIESLDPAVKGGAIFSLSGISASIEYMRKECAKGQSMVDQTFEKSFLLPSLNPEALKLLDAQQIEELKKMYQDAYRANSQVNEKVNAIGKLSSEFKGKLAQADGYKALAQSYKKELDSKLAEKAKYEAEVEKYEAELKKIAVATDQEIQKKVMTQETLAQIEGRLTELKPEYTQFNETYKITKMNYDTARRSVSENASEIDALENEIRQLDAQLKASSQDRVNRMSWIQAQQQQLANLESSLKAYDIGYESQKILNNEPNYENSRKSIDMYSMQIGQMNGHLEVLRMNMRGTVQRMRAMDCPQIPFNPDQGDLAKGDAFSHWGRGIAQVKPNPPPFFKGGPGSFKGPGVGPLDPNLGVDNDIQNDKQGSQDPNQKIQRCEQLAKRLMDTKNRAFQIVGARNQYRNEILNQQQYVAQFESDVKNYVMSVKESLQAQFMDLNTQVRMQQNAVETNAMSEKIIFDVEIPKRKSQKQSASQQTGQLQSFLSDRKQEMDTAKNYLEAFKIANGYDALVENRRQAIDALENSDKMLAKYKKSNDSNIDSLEKQKKKLQISMNNIESHLAKIDANDKQTQSLNTELTAYFAAKETLDSETAQLQLFIKEQKENFSVLVSKSVTTP